MCGIAGIAEQPAGPPAGADAAVRQMVAAMTHRGPDHGAVSGAGRGGMRATLGDRRLSILDLTAGGNQPMVSEAGDLRLVYNGELYNHPELRAELEGRGHRFHSRADTETVLHAYQEWGTEAFARFNGMFALAIHDLRRDVLVLARDRRG